MPGPVSARSWNARKQGPGVRISFEVRIFARMLLSFLTATPSVLHHRCFLTQCKSLKSGNTATRLLHIAGVNTTPLANRMRPARVACQA
jgi:hypothetical protein